jgi:hypothetical protein
VSADAGGPPHQLRHTRGSIASSTSTPLDPEYGPIIDDLIATRTWFDGELSASPATRFGRIVPNNSEFETDTDSDGIPDSWTFQPCIPGNVLISLEPYSAPAPTTVPPTPPSAATLGSFNQRGVLIRNAGSAPTCASLTSLWLKALGGSKLVVSAAVRPHTQANAQSSLAVQSCTSSPSCVPSTLATVTFNRDDGYRVLSTKVTLPATATRIALRYSVNSPAPSSLSIDDVRVIRIE